MRRRLDEQLQCRRSSLSTDSRQSNIIDAIKNFKVFQIFQARNDDHALRERQLIRTVWRREHQLNPCTVATRTSIS